MEITCTFSRIVGMFIATVNVNGKVIQMAGDTEQEAIDKLKETLA